MADRVDNAIIMAAGVASRFAPLSYEKPKALLPVKGEVLLERQIRQLREAGIRDIFVVVGYKKEQFAYLVPRFGVHLIENPSYASHNNSSSIFAARQYLKNSFICSADNYFARSPFSSREADSYYAALFAEGPTSEWCLEIDSSDLIKGVRIGGANCWYMLGHSFWNADFSRSFRNVLDEEYAKPATKDMFWEDLFVLHLTRLPMRIRRYRAGDIFEFDSLDELRDFDPAYQLASGSAILADLAVRLGRPEKDLHGFSPQRDASGQVMGFSFFAPEGQFIYNYAQSSLAKVQTNL